MRQIYISLSSVHVLEFVVVKLMTPYFLLEQYVTYYRCEYNFVVIFTSRTKINSFSSAFIFSINSFSDRIDTLYYLAIVVRTQILYIVVIVDFIPFFERLLQIQVLKMKYSDYIVERAILDQFQPISGLSTIVYLDFLLRTRCLRYTTSFQLLKYSTLSLALIDQTLLSIAPNKRRNIIQLQKLKVQSLTSRYLYQIH